MQNKEDSIRNNTKLTIVAILMLYLFFPAAVKGDWESEANARIEQIRKRDVQITVVDSNGSPVSDLNVQIDQIYHRFAFGACLAYSPLATNNSYRNFFLDHFEWAVCENEMKWASNESTRDVETYSQADYIANWCADNDIILRGHCVVWETGSQTPSWVSGLDCETYPTSSEMLDEIDERINSIVGRYAGQIVSWDVDNEMLSGDMFDCLGEAGRAHFFQLGNSIDPNCGFYMNEYSGNSFGGYDGDAYAARANNLIALGAPVEGLGIQAHLDSPFQPENYYNNVLEELAVLGLPIIATEFDTDAATETQRTDDLENFYRICFSHAKVEGIIMWGFWENSAWRWDGIVNSDWTLNAAGVRYEQLLDEWTTEDSNYTDLSGNVNFRGFHGTYEITLSAPGEPAEMYIIELEPGETAAEFVLETDLESPGPDFNSPEPNIMTWALVPTTVSASSITMTATTATDDSPPVQYYFECTTDGDANSGWQTDETYLAQGLNPSTTYTFRVKARDSSPNRNETEWSTERSATTEPPGTEVEIIGDWVEGLTHTKEAGFDRALIFIAHEESASGTPTLTSVTYGDREMNKVIEITSDTSGSNYRNYVAAFILDEPNIAAATNSDFSITWSASTSSVAYSSVLLQNVDQTDPLGDSDSAQTGSGTDPISTSALATSEGDMVIDAATCGNVGSYTLTGFTEGTDQQFGGGSGGTGATGYASATGADEISTADYSATVNRQVIIGFVVQAALPDPNNVTNPNPTNGESNVSVSTNLSWDAPTGYTPTSYDVYFGTNPSAHSNPHNTVYTNSYDLPGDLAEGTTYYWVVDSNDNGTIHTGYPWTFITEGGYCGDGICDAEEDCWGCEADCGACVDDPIWEADARCFLDGPPGEFDDISVKDPTIVYYGGEWHLFYTGRDVGVGGHFQMGYASAPTIPELNSATRYFLRDVLSGGDYFCAPQVFWFEEKGLWYLIYQSGLGPTFSTNTDINDPNGWTAGESMGFSGGVVDYWCISDGSYVYCFYSPLGTTILARRTTVEDFPLNWSAAWTVATQTFEASHVYKNIADGKYYMMVEDVSRHFELWTASDLGGTWTKLQENWAHGDQLVFNADHWTDQVSHGEIIRAGVDEKLEINSINRCEILIQGVVDGNYGDYGNIPYDLGIIRRQCPAKVGDINLDCGVDFKDFAVLAGQWLQLPGVPSADIAPLSGDGIVDMNDLSLLVDCWLWGK